MTTITPLHADDIQAAFDHMVRHLAGMPNRSLGEADYCAYRADKTGGCQTRCVVGSLIPDDQYTPNIEGSGANDLGFAVPLVSLDWLDMAANMQELHDDEDSWGTTGFDNWDLVRYVADIHGLSADVVDEVTA